MSRTDGGSKGWMLRAGARPLGGVRLGEIWKRRGTAGEKA